MNLLQLEQQIRYVRFTWDGKESNLYGTRGEIDMPEELLKALINECGVEINADGRFDVEIKHDSLTSGSDVIAMPTNLLAVQKIIIFDDANTAGSSTAVSAHKESDGIKLDGPVLSYEYLLQGRTGLTGQPTKFCLHEQAGVLYAQLDREADAAYFFSVYYWPAPATMSTDSATPDISSHYHNLYRALAAKKVAEVLGDDRSIVRHTASYENFMRKVKGLRYGAPRAVRFQLINGMGN